MADNDERILHPWARAAEVFDPMPMPVYFRLDKIGVTLEDGTRENAVIITAATPGGVNTYFMNNDDFRAFAENAANMVEEMGHNSPLIIKEAGSSVTHIGLGAEILRGK